ncbi:hypothetical protein [Streptomyces sp. KN37]|uniref:hypothetical protein n=1 Tax=Streptomyces sp. KN37 TaxID=3090667 RepID=UPI002A75064C|nr:hypothetical protein [Streptomyces sp. KN37]WPO73988.1 hypothetical protein R9806_26905 [Streptomyces sp. KN37]
MSECNDWNAYVEQLLLDCADREATATLRAGQSPADSGEGEPGVAALPTIYRGTQFRSLLEASWAATLDSLNIAWEYEPEIFELPSGAKYLPDFHLSEIGVWLEVKGPGIPRIEKPYALGEMLACGCEIASCDCAWPGGEMVIVGHPPKPFDPWSDERYTHWPRRSKAKVARNHGGFLRWTSTRRYNSWLTRCSGCARTVWVEGARLRRCPACGGANTSQLYRDFENRFEFTRLPWLSAANTQLDEDAAA